MNGWCKSSAFDNCDSFDDAMVKAINDVIESGVHRGMIVGMLHAYAHEQTRRMVDEGYA